MDNKKIETEFFYVEANNDYDIKQLNTFFQKSNIFSFIKEQIEIIKVDLEKHGDKKCK